MRSVFVRQNRPTLPPNRADWRSGNNTPWRDYAFWFVISLLAGLALGILYGWLINPAQIVDTSPNTLRKDYKTDYVLIVAEIYAREEDIDQATRRLALLGSEQPVRLVQRAILDGQALGYASVDLETLGNLLQGLQVVQENILDLQPTRDGSQ